MQLFDPETDEEFAVWTVRSIEVVDSCEEDYGGGYTETVTPENGHFVVLDISIATSGEFDAAEGLYVGDPMAFSVLGGDGVTESNLSTASSYGCFSAETLPVELMPSQKYTGKIVLDSRNTSGSLIYKDMGDVNGVE
ncbi:MAG: hypothetical protein GEU98_26160 [Pseudonocardiaceae bacterium]|nr:hypothetical protein [Pseudonocardiaceae bacterium]